VKEKPVRPRELANRDIDAAIEHYLSEASEKVALGFIDELQKAFAKISTNPGSGSPRYAHELDLPDLRFKATARYPYLVFYVECDDCIDVWRVLHGERDIPGGVRMGDE
jgi:toxin ParE1/3/4